MLCPECGKYELQREKVEEIEIDRCLACHGIWLNANELEQLIKADPKTLLEEDGKFEPPAEYDGRLRFCPHCRGAKMVKLNSRIQPEIILDCCSVCHGTWLEAGEYSHLAGHGFVHWIQHLFLG